VSSASTGGPTLAIIALSGEAPSVPTRQGSFGTVTVHALPKGAAPDRETALSASIETARSAGADWMIALAPGESLTDDALELVSPALDLCDAIFGAAHLTGSGDPVARLTRLAFDTADRLPHALLNWWMPNAHFIRVETATGALAALRSPDTGHWRLDYLFSLWATARCLKSAQPLLELDEEPQPLGAPAREHVLRHLSAVPVFLPVVHGDTEYFLPYTGQNAGIEREQSRGLFFEAMELEELRKAVKPRAHIVDVGANTGNHTIFFAGPMRAASVMPFEPLPAAARALESAVRRNELSNVDLSNLGIGVGDRAVRAKLTFSDRGGLGATSLVPDPEGEISVATLDSMVSGPVDFLKIDVEGMEMSVLAGAEQLIRRTRPLIYIEIANANTSAFVEWLDAARYQVERIFTDKGHANYLIAPKVVA
jgi:FkbM family methyltransferase